MKIQSINREALLSFVDHLRSNQFHCGVDTIISVGEAIQFIEDKYKNKPNSENHFLSDVKTALSSIICTNFEEIEKFNVLFDNNFVQSQLNVKQERFNHLLLPILNKIISKYKLAFKRKVNKYLFALLFIILILILWIILCPRPCANFNIRNNDVVFKKTGTTIAINDFITIDLKDTSDYIYEAFLHQHKVKTFNYSKSLSLTQPGEDTLTILLKPNKCRCNTNTIFHYNLFIGTENEATIQPLKNGPIKVNEINTFSYVPDSNFTGEFAWYVNDSTKQDWKNTKQIKQEFNSEGNFNIEIRYNLFKDSSLNKYSDEYTTRYIQVVEKNNLLDINLTTKNVSKTSTFNINIIYIFLYVLLLLTLFSIGLYWIIKKKNAARTYSLFGKPEDENTSEKGPFDIPFKSNIGAIQKSKEIIDLGKFLKDYGSVDGLKFDIHSTIRATIKNNGFIAPSFKERIVKSKHIILIDKVFENSQPFHLFVYLVNHLINDALDVEIYYFYQFPKFLYASDNERNTIEIDQLLESSSDSKIFVFSTGTSLLSFTQPLIKAEYKAIFSNWNDKILITPIPYLDWSNNEKWLSKSFKIVPADISGLLHIIHLLSNDEEEKSAIFQQPYFETYSSKYIDFTSIDELRIYLKDEDLFQWMCALAVYPKVDWCLTIEIGKAVLGQNQYKINYENLLKLSRVKWMFDGKFSSADRLMLLKPLSFENELKARATILKVLDAIDLDKNSFAYEESLVAKYMNGFMLKASGTEGNSFYKPIYASESIDKYYSGFLYHQQNGNFLDVAFSNYVEKKGDGDWETPIRNLGDSTFPNNPTLTEYFNKLLIDYKKAFDLKRDPGMWLNTLITLFFIIFSIYVTSDKKGFYNTQLNQVLGIVQKIDMPIEQAYITIGTSDLCKDYITSNFSEVRLVDKTKTEYYSSNLVGIQDSGLLKIAIDSNWLDSSNWGKNDQFTLEFLNNTRFSVLRKGMKASENFDFNISKGVNYNFNIQSKKCQKLQIIYFENEELANMLKSNLEDKYDLEMVKNSATISELKITQPINNKTDSLSALVSILSSTQPVLEINRDSSKTIKIYVPDKAKSSISFIINYHKSEFKIANLIKAYLSQNKYNVVSYRSSEKINESEIIYRDFNIKPVVERAYNLLYGNFYKPFKVRYLNGNIYKQINSNTDQIITINIGPLNECKLKDIGIAIIKTESNNISFKLDPIYNKSDCSIDGKYQYTVVDEKNNILNTINPRDFVLNKVESFYDFNFSYDLRFNKFYKIGIIDFLTKEVLFTSDPFEIEEPIITPPVILEPRIYNLKVTSDKSIYEEGEILQVIISYNSEGNISNLTQEIGLSKSDSSVIIKDKIILASKNPFFYEISLDNIIKRKLVLSTSGLQKEVTKEYEILTISLENGNSILKHNVRVLIKTGPKINQIPESNLIEIPVYSFNNNDSLFNDLELYLSKYNNQKLQIEILHFENNKNSRLIYDDLINLINENKIPKSKYKIDQIYNAKIPTKYSKGFPDIKALIKIDLLKDKLLKSNK